MSDDKRPEFGCGGCDNRWNGHATCHCAACHTTFVGVTAFDKHRAGSYAKKRYCLTMEGAGLVRSTVRNYECYCLPGEEEAEEKRVQALGR